MKRNTAIALAVLATLLSGCSTVDWVGTGERWWESLCRDQNQGHCPKEDLINETPLR